ncbi:ABC transporter permease [Corynebacterium maris DSM 45190]|uniref:Transport permease protein n=2 Tax=Corynebacterium TaxID=1716 RepID=S5TKG6_9CORY|nr:ABC transporter permease [Corynebacterium maris DSM 45190]
MFLGQLWILLNPVLQVALFAFVFGVILNVSRGIDNFIGFLILGVIFFGFVSGGLSAGSGLIQSSRNLINSFQFPKASLAISSTVKQAIDNVAPAVLAVVACVLFQLDQPLHWTIVFVIPVYLLIHIFCLGAALIGARVTAFVPDTKALIRVLTRVLFFLSGIFYSVERFATQPVIQEIMLANPIYQFLRAVRNSVMLGTVPTWQEWLYLSTWSFGLLIFGLIFFWRAEARYSSVK